MLACAVASVVSYSSSSVRLFQSFMGMIRHARLPDVGIMKLVLPYFFPIDQQFNPFMNNYFCISLLGHPPANTRCSDPYFLKTYAEDNGCQFLMFFETSQHVCHS